jgi:aspartyl aminopeptidase
MTLDVADLLTYLDASPSPFHAAASTAARLDAAGFHCLSESDDWPAGDGAFYVVRSGALVAWVVGPEASTEAGFVIVGAHTDSPNLRLKPRPDAGRGGVRQLGIEVYGGALLNSWLDRDLGLSGRVVVRGDQGPQTRLIHIDRPLARIPQLAIHLDRGVNESGLVLNPQVHLAPVWGLGPVTHGDLVAFIADELGIDPTAILGSDLMLHDTTPAALVGRDRELVGSGRLDNLVSCWAGTWSLIAAATAAPRLRQVPVLCLFDHEEVGSTSSTGAAGSVLPTMLERIVAAENGSRTWFHRALAASWCVSADGAHATHPNYAERHEPGHAIALDGGPVIKRNANVRYATDAESEARFMLACEAADVPFQRFVVRSDMACGSTIGPVTAAQLGVSTVDAGVAQLAMHSARELCGVRDPVRFAAVLQAAFTQS